jgi:peptidoglycan hydrolase-like amidase
MSQYGANGAARAGLTAAQITSFDYPGTTLA